jgi:hypothetical protein
LSILNCDELSPAAVKAVVRYGWSKSTHRVDDVVSGRITPICRPDPADAVSPLSVDIVDAMSTVKESAVSPDGTVAALEAAEDAAVEAAEEAAVDAGADDVDDDDEQPAATTATAAAAATKLSRGRVLPPCPLLPSCIPYPFHRNAVRSYTTMRDTAHHVCPHALKGRSLGHGASSG